MLGSKLCIHSECLVEREKTQNLNHGVLSWSGVGGRRRRQMGDDQETRRGEGKRGNLRRY